MTNSSACASSFAPFVPQPRLGRSATPTSNKPGRGRALLLLGPLSLAINRIVLYMLDGRDHDSEVVRGALPQLVYRRDPPNVCHFNRTVGFGLAFLRDDRIATLHGCDAGHTMNSINIISARVSPPPTPTGSRSNSVSHVGLVPTAEKEIVQPESVLLGHDAARITTEPEEDRAMEHDDYSYMTRAVEKTPLLEKSVCPEGNGSSWWHLFPGSISWLLSALAAPGVYILGWLWNEQGYFIPRRQFRKLFGRRNTPRVAVDDYDAVTNRRDSHARRTSQVQDKHISQAMRRARSSGSSSSGLSESESDVTSRSDMDNVRSASGSRHSRSKSSPKEEIAPARRSIRIKLHNEDALRQRKHKKAQSASAKSGGDGGSKDLSAQLKSPTSPVGALTKYPKTPAPPRPLIPRRQPSYLPYEAPDPKHMKTLILDLDETLIHSMSKGGRMGSGHMVEVRLNTTYVGSVGQQQLGPQHPILYYVHKRPHCDEFLRKVSQWFNLVIFTASVQEYADPVIDWLESERKYFTGRFYRQHCTFRHGAFIKDLSSVEPDLSKVMILDNSPLSYMFHQDNAIPIQGWINDPTDNDLVHLVPLLEGLQYVSDVRALLALRGGEDGQHMTA